MKPEVNTEDMKRIRGRGDGPGRQAGGLPRRGDTLGRAGIKLES